MGKEDNVITAYENYAPTKFTRSFRSTSSRVVTRSPLIPFFLFALVEEGLGKDNGKDGMKPGAEHTKVER